MSDDYDRYEAARVQIDAISRVTLPGRLDDLDAVEHPRWKSVVEVRHAQCGFKLAAIAARRRSGVESGKSTTPSSGRVPRPKICV